MRWVNRGGGCLLHLPGQMAIYPVLPLDRLGLGLQAYLDRLRQVLADVLDDFGVAAAAGPDPSALYVGAGRWPMWASRCATGSAITAPP